MCCRLDESLLGLCAKSDAVNLAVDGWSDRRGRRYQGIVVRFLNMSKMTARPALLALKEIKTIHQNGVELRLTVERLQGRFDIKNKTINICTDRCLMNEFTFWGDLTEQFFTGAYWIPCVCHFLNNLLARFMENISDVLAPVLHLQQRFGKNGSFLSFLESRDVSQSIPSHSAIRWYSSNAVFSTFLKLPNHISAFALQEHIALSELNDTVKINPQLLAQLTGQFSDAQKSLEGDVFGNGILFIGTLCAIKHNVKKLRQQHPTAVATFERQVDDFKRKYDRAYHCLLMVTFLDPVGAT
jgi:hypothetical protein